jgi:hypothetical protein
LEKIPETFYSQSGQVHKDEQGQLKVQVVLDWPICASFTRDNEYKKFFELAEHMNNYHPNSKDISVQNMSYKLIRYQINRVKNFNIFSKEEQEFLQSYDWL